MCAICVCVWLCLQVVVCQDIRSLDMAVSCRDNALAWLERYLRIKEMTDREPHHRERESTQQGMHTRIYISDMYRWRCLDAYGPHIQRTQDGGERRGVSLSCIVVLCVSEPLV